MISGAGSHSESIETSLLAFITPVVFELGNV